MKIVERRLLRGNNLYSRKPCLMAILDLEDLDDVSSAALPGFTDRLLALLPSLVEHRCSPGHVGGFVERLRDGTYPAHIVEHITLELQCLAGHRVGFGRARTVQGRPRHFRVVLAYLDESLVEAALDMAMELVACLAAERPFSLAGGLERLKALAASAAVGPSTQAIVEAAQQRSIPVLRLTERASLYQLGWGIHQQRIQATLTSRTNHVAVEIAGDKALTKRLLAQAGLPVPRGETVLSTPLAEEAARKLNGAVVVKPCNANQGKGVSTLLTCTTAVAAACEHARRWGPRVLVEQHIEGADYRVLVVGRRMVAAARRVPPQVVGDGQSTIRELVEQENRRPQRGEGHDKVLTKIALDAVAAACLQDQGLAFEAVPQAGATVRLRGNANLSTGGTAEDVTAKVHPDTARACVRAARTIGLDVAGIDIVCRDIALPLEAQGGAMIEVNAAPGIRMHEHPSLGAPQPAGRAIVDSLFAPGNDGRIPVVAVTGTNGKTTTTLAIAHVLQRRHVTGVTTTEGVSIDGERVWSGDCSGFASARMVLASPIVEVAVLETARGGMLKRGLAFDRCDVSVVLNISADHLGQDGVQTLEELAAVKGLIVDAAHTAVVLNAQDPLCLGMVRKTAPGVEVILFSLDPHDAAFTAHIESGGRGICERDGWLVWAEGEDQSAMVGTSALPFTLHGRARHNVANAMAAIGALKALGIAAEEIVAGLSDFSSNERQNPLRLNLYRIRDVTVLIDYAHNPAACQAIIATARQLTTGRVIGVITAPGDRQDAHLREIGRLCGNGFDALVLYEADDRRGRSAGATAALLAEGAHEALSDSVGQCLQPVEVQTVLDIRNAIRAALARADAGDMVVVASSSQLSDLRCALGNIAEIDPANLPGSEAHYIADTEQVDLLLSGADKAKAVALPLQHDA